VASLNGSNHYIAFYGAGASGLTTSSFTIIYFTRDGSTINSITDPVTFHSFSIVSVGGGYYYAKYTPSQGGFYYLAFSCAAHSIFIADAADIDELSVINLSQDTSGTNALKPITVPGDSTPLNEYILMIFQSSDWQVGRIDNTYAVAMTQLDDQGNWLTTPLAVSPGTYHLVIKNNYGTTQVFKPFLEV
jgi:hypothetical protein